MRSYGNLPRSDQDDLGKSSRSPSRLHFWGFSLFHFVIADATVDQPSEDAHAGRRHPRPPRVAGTLPPAGCIGLLRPPPPLVSAARPSTGACAPVRTRLDDQGPLQPQVEGGPGELTTLVKVRIKRSLWPETKGRGPTFWSALARLVMARIGRTSRCRPCRCKRLFQ